MDLCRKCGSQSRVVDSRLRYDKVRWRRRECENCGSRWNTLEIKADETASPPIIRALVATCPYSSDQLRRKRVPIDDSIWASTVRSIRDTCFPDDAEPFNRLLVGQSPGLPRDKQA